MTKTKGGRITKSKREELLANIRGLFETGQIRYYSERELSLKFNYARETIRKYIEEVRMEVDPADIQHTQLKFKSLFEQAIATCEQLVQNAIEEQRERDARDSIRLLLETIKQQTDFMERFFIKDKVVDKIDLKADVTQKTFSVQIIDDRRAIENEGSN